MKKPLEQDKSYEWHGGFNYIVTGKKTEKWSKIEDFEPEG